MGEVEDPGVKNDETVNGPVSRQDLYRLVWSEPMLKVAARFGVSSSYMARVCTMLNVPRPERGYWARHAVGNAPKKTPLPARRAGDLLEWTRGRSLDAQPSRSRPGPLNVYQRRTRQAPSELPEEHPILSGAKPLFEAGRLSWNGNYLKPSKKRLVDLVASKSALDMALAFANELFLAFEARGHRVMFDPTHERFHRAEVDQRENPKHGERMSDLWCPTRCTVVYVGTAAFGLTLIEMTEHVPAEYRKSGYVRANERARPSRSRNVYHDTWSTMRDLPSGRLCLQVYSPYPRVKWLKHWRETPARPLSAQISRIIRELEAATADVARLFDEGERQAEIERKHWEEQRERWRREEEARRAAQALKDSRDELEKIIDSWAEAKRLEGFFAEAEQRLVDLPRDERDQVLERIQHARELFGAIDALQLLKAWRAPEER
jgi:hypothetical protein